MIKKLIVALFSLACMQNSFAQNQTETISPILPSTSLPFQVRIEQADFSLPNGVHSFASALYKGKWLIIAGRTNGMHGFNNDDNNFPPQEENRTVYVVDPDNKRVWTRSLTDPSSLLSQSQIDLLAVTSPQSYQHHKTLYISGGYGVDSSTGLFSTKPSLIAINIPKMIQWVIKGTGSALETMRQTTSPFMQVTGGYMARVDKDLSLLIFGQNFAGFYLDSSNGSYTRQVRRFKVIDDGISLSIKPLDSESPNPNYRRRDLNVVPIIQKASHFEVPAFVALSGVFTEDVGIWTVPVLIASNGKSSMANPADPKTFKQGMNNYTSPTIGLYSSKNEAMYTTLLGGISFGYFEGSTFETDSEFPFINQVTTIKIDKEGKYTQHLMNGSYPVIPSTGSNPGNALLFGAGAFFMPNPDLPAYSNGVFKMDKFDHQTQFLGYIVGGIQSTLPNTNTMSDSAASPYIFKVYFDPQ